MSGRQNFWLDPNGRLHNSGNSHNKFAEQFIENNIEYNKMFLEVENDIVEYHFEFLHYLGWVRVTINNNKISILGNSGAPDKILRNTMQPAMNPKQLRVAKKLCKEFNHTFLDAINK